MAFNSIFQFDYNGFLQYLKKYMEVEDKNKME